MGLITGVILSVAIYTVAALSLCGHWIIGGALLAACVFEVRNIGKEA